MDTTEHRAVRRPWGQPCLAQRPAPRLGGGLRVEFTIRTDGSVEGVYVTENTVSPMVGECVVTIIDALHFTPGPTGGSVRFRFPFVFAPGG